MQDDVNFIIIRVVVIISREDRQFGGSENE